MYGNLFICQRTLEVYFDKPQHIMYGNNTMLLKEFGKNV